jgi:hypothetical protein
MVTSFPSDVPFHSAQSPMKTTFSPGFASMAPWYAPNTTWSRGILASSWSSKSRRISTASSIAPGQPPQQ